MSRSPKLGSGQVEVECVTGGGFTRVQTRFELSLCLSSLLVSLVQDILKQVTEFFSYPTSVWVPALVGTVGVGPLDPV